MHGMSDGDHEQCEDNFNMSRDMNQHHESIHARYHNVTAIGKGKGHHANSRNGCH